MESNVTQKQVDIIYEKSKKEFSTVYDKCTVLAVQLPNGFVLIESSASVDPNNYGEEIGIEICEERIKDKIWELEGYRLQNELKK